MSPSDAGAYTVVASKGNYASAQVALSVSVGQTLQQNFALKTGLAAVTPANIQLIMPIGQTRTRTLVLQNTAEQ